MKELLEKIPPEKRWAITAKILIIFAMLRGVKTILPLLGKGEGIISPIWGWEKWTEINDKIWTEGGRKFFPRIKETFNIPVEDALGAYKLLWVAKTFQGGPEAEDEIIEATPKRVVVRVIKCPWMERYKELEVDSELLVCQTACQVNSDEGLKAVNPQLTHTLRKAQPRGDPNCEWVIEFKD